MAILGSLILRTFDENRESERVYTFTDLFSCDGKDIPLIEFDEYKGFTLESSFDSEVEIKIESPDSDWIILQHNKRLILCESGNDGYVPGNYRLDVIYKNRVLRLFFRVLPSALSQQELKDLRYAIDQFQEGLSRELFFKQISNDFAKHDPTIKNEYDEYHQIMRNQTKLFRQLDKIIQDPIISLQKVYVVGNDSRRSDRKTEKWMDTKGKRKNDQFSEDTYFLNRKVVQDTNSIENRLLKSHLDEYRHHVSHLIERFDKKGKFFIEHISTILSDIDVTKDLVHKTNVESEIKALNSHIERRTLEISDFYAKMSIIGSYVSNLKIVQRTVDQYLFQTWLKELKGNVALIRSAARVTNFSYRRSIQLMTPKSVTKTKDGTVPMNELQFRNTSYLFEVYVLLLIHRLLLDLGYEPQDTEMFTRNYGFIDAIVESTMVYRKDNHRIEVRYDKQVKKKHNHRISDFYNLNAYSNKPDILIAKWDEQTDTLLDAFIVEVKCVKKHYLVSEFEQTKLTDQFKDYLSFGYLDKSNEQFVLQRGVIRKVIVVYPDKEEEEYALTYNLIEYIGINPNVLNVDSLLYERISYEIINYGNSIEYLRKV